MLLDIAFAYSAEIDGLKYLLETKSYYWPCKMQDVRSINSLQGYYYLIWLLLREIKLYLKLTSQNPVKLWFPKGHS